jgi:hypothetical protein
MNMNDVFAIVMALLLTYSGMACLSLAMPRHYDQVWGRDPSAGHTRVLRGAGVLLLALALLPCVGLWGNTVGPGGGHFAGGHRHRLLRPTGHCALRGLLPRV